MVFEVKNPIPGFEDVTSVEITDTDNFFAKLSTKNRDEGRDPISITLINPYSIDPSYDFILPTDLETLLEVKENSELRVYNVVVLNKTIEESAVNMLSPIVCNVTNKTIAQVVLDPKKYPAYSSLEPIGKLVQKNVFEVKGSILGFEDIKKVQISPVDTYLASMKSIESDEKHKTISFTLINPYVLRPDYDFSVPTPYQILLDLKDSADIAVFNMVILNKTIEESGVNFLAPIVCNVKNKTLAQVILDPKNYPMYGHAERVGDLIKKDK